MTTSVVPEADYLKSCVVLSLKHVFYGDFVYREARPISTFE